MTDGQLDPGTKRPASAVVAYFETFHDVAHYLDVDGRTTAKVVDEGIPGGVRRVVKAKRPGTLAVRSEAARAGLPRRRGPRGDDPL